MARSGDTASVTLAQLDAATAVPTIGVSLVILALGVLAQLVATRGGSLILATALDPAQAQSLPDLWGQLQLAAVAALLWSCRTAVPGAGTAAFLPLVLLMADATDVSARCAHSLAALLPMAPPYDSVAAKLASGVLVGGMALAPALDLWRRSCLAERRLGRRLAATLIFGGLLSLTLDAAGSRDGHQIAVAEEAVELLLYSMLAARLLRHALQDRRVMGLVGVDTGQTVRCGG